MANHRDIIAIAGSFVLAFLATIGASTFISLPIQLLLDAAEHWRQGSLDVRVPSTKVRSEFGRLGAAFNAMAAGIGAREHQLEHKGKERAQSLREAMQAQQATEVALYEARKMETVGRLTGGVAHDFNNPLATIAGSIELARTRLAPEHPASFRLDAAMQSQPRCRLDPAIAGIRTPSEPSSRFRESELPYPRLPKYVAAPPPV